VENVPWGVVAPVLAVVLVIDVLLLLDLRRREVTGMPKAAWAAVIVLVSFPVGPLLYWFVGRVPPNRADSGATVLPPPTGPAVAVAPPLEGTTRLDGAAAWQPTGEMVLATSGLRKIYEVAAVDGVDLRVPRGATYGLIGPNGAGKTTLLSLIAGLRQPTAGAIDLRVERRRMAVLPDTPQFEPWLTAREVVDLARSLVAPDVPADRVDAALAEVDLTAAANRRLGGFSRGMLQRVGLATCLVSDPALLVMDEPSSALDPAGRREVLDLIARLAGERTVVLSTHVLTDVQQVCDVVGVLQSGRLVFQGPIEDLLARTSSVYRLRLGAPDPTLADALRRADWVADVTPDGAQAWRVVVTDIAAAEDGIAPLLAAHGARLHAFAPAADLEAAFLELTEGPR
jgi:ABC-2 type transport system ATP-binding protein